MGYYFLFFKLACKVADIIMAFWNKVCFRIVSFPSSPSFPCFLWSLLVIRPHTISNGIFKRQGHCEAGRLSHSTTNTQGSLKPSKLSPNLQVRPPKLLEFQASSTTTRLQCICSSNFYSWKFHTFMQCILAISIYLQLVSATQSPSQLHYLLLICLLFLLITPKFT